MNVGLLICEDAWFETPAEDSVAAGAELLVVINASPFHRGKGGERERMMAERVRATGKPLVVSMGSVAASGGYWIAAPADEIWAAPTTITGSIGVLSAFPSFARALGELGIHNDGVATTRSAGGLDPSRELSPQMRKVMELANAYTYRRFMEIVAEGRGMPVERVAELAEGRVWTGAQAEANGLVDHLGNLDDAIAGRRLRQVGFGHGRRVGTASARLARRSLLLVLHRPLLAGVYDISVSF